MTHPIQSPKKYRQDIDGLRAVAVLMVVLFHAGFDFVKGGYVGVDIFFVISGYLITRKIKHDLDKGVFSLSNFYNGRIRRLMPAYIVVSAVTFVFATNLLIPLDYKFYTTSLVTSYFSASNIFFSMMSGGYFSSRMEEFPLLHTWSLAVEEQFYYLWPAFLIICYKYKRKLNPSFLLIGIFTLSLIFSEWASSQSNTSAYFLIQYRAFELLLGALITTQHSEKYTLKPWHNNALSIIGLIVIFASATILTKNSRFPGLNALWPSLGAAILIFSGRDASSISSKFLSLKPLVWIGLLSYSLYLWHWPIFAFLRYTHVELNSISSTLAIFLSIVLSFFSWKYVEIPFRKQYLYPFKKTLILLFITPAFFALSCGIIVYLGNGIPQRFSPEIREITASYSSEIDLGRDCSIHKDDYANVTLKHLTDKCAFGPNKNNHPQLLLIGDSHANHIKPFLEVLTSDAGFGSVYHVQGSCSVADGFMEGDVHDASTTPSCIKRNGELLRMAKSFKYVVLASNWSAKKGKDDFKRSLESVVLHVIKTGARPVIIKDVAGSQVDLSRCILYKKLGWAKDNTNCNIPLEDFRGAHELIDEAIDEIQKENKSVIIIDPNNILCSDNGCVTSIKNTAIYRDTSHINAIASQLLGKMYLNKYGNPFNN
ncbi:MAG: acyltransferase [Gammaproteobacteria bacterium]|nr:acyltransferase [Gammaproteobacteria bacterium]